MPPKYFPSTPPKNKAKKGKKFFPSASRSSFIVCFLAHLILPPSLSLSVCRRGPRPSCASVSGNLSSWHHFPRGMVEVLFVPSSHCLMCLWRLVRNRGGVGWGVRLEDREFHRESGICPENLQTCTTIKHNTSATKKPNRQFL